METMLVLQKRRKLREFQREEGEGVKETIKIRDGFGHTASIDATRVTIPGLEWGKDLEFYLHKEANTINCRQKGKWVITEKSAGAALAHGKTQKAVMCEALARLLYCGEAGFKKKVAEIIKKHGGLK